MQHQLLVNSINLYYPIIINLFHDVFLFTKEKFIMTKN